MKKSLLALAALTVFASAASAQSSVTIGGYLDLGVGKRAGSSDKGVNDNNAFGEGDSRINFTIVEDLGGGMAALGALEHRINVDDGTAAGSVFWNGYSYVGLRGGFGRVLLGRYYTSAFLNVQNQVDPWGGETVAMLRNVGMGLSFGAPQPAAVAAVLGTPKGLTAGPFYNTGAGVVRFANGIRYDVSAGGFTFAADMSEKGKDNTGAADATIVNRPWSVAATYGAGPLWIGVSQENPGKQYDKLTNLGLRYGFGGATLRLGLGNGTTPTNLKVKSYLIGGNIAMGNGDLRLGYANIKVGGTNMGKRFGVGYAYNLSKRTSLYTDFVRDGALATQKTGYDFGIKHIF